MSYPVDFIVVTYELSYVHKLLTECYLENVPSLSLKLSNLRTKFRNSLIYRRNFHRLSNWPRNGVVATCCLFFLKCGTWGACSLTPIHSELYAIDRFSCVPGDHENSFFLFVIYWCNNRESMFECFYVCFLYRVSLWLVSGVKWNTFFMHNFFQIWVK